MWCKLTRGEEEISNAGVVTDNARVVGVKEWNRDADCGTETSLSRPGQGAGTKE